MSGKKRTPKERALIYAAILGEATFEHVNQLLSEADFRSLPQASYDMVREKYVPVFRLHPPALLQALTSPQSMSALARYGREDAEAEWEFVLPDERD